MTKLIALVDADGLLYAAALEGQIDCDGSPLVVASLDYVYKRCLERLEDMVDLVKADDAFICLSDRRNFRNAIMPVGHRLSKGGLGYKGQRKEGSRPLLLDKLRAKMVEEAPYKVMLIEGLEADDVAGIAQGTFQKVGSRSVIISADKDMLTIPGDLLTVHYTGNSRTMVTEEMANRWHMTQTLMGDTVDNYCGLPGWGAVKAGILMDEFDMAELSFSERWSYIRDLFVKGGYTEEEFLDQARVSRILRASDWDTVAKEPILFDPYLTAPFEVAIEDASDTPEEKAA